MRHHVRRVLRLLRGEGGITLVEIGISAAITLLLGGLMTSWMVAVGSANAQHEADDDAVQTLRNARSHLTKELRGAEVLTTAEPYEVSLWLDTNRNAAFDAGEMITWEITTEGVLRRTTDAGESGDFITGLVVPQSGFGYDAAAPGDVTFFSVDLTLYSTGDRVYGDRSISTEVELRNASLGGSP